MKRPEVNRICTTLDGRMEFVDVGLDDDIKKLEVYADKVTAYLLKLCEGLEVENIDDLFDDDRPALCFYLGKYLSDKIKSLQEDNVKLEKAAVIITLKDAIIAEQELLIHELENEEAVDQ